MKFAKYAARIKRKGFTLVELIVVIAILAILAVTAVMAIGNISASAREAALRADCNTAVRALNMHNSLAASGATLKSLTGQADQLRNLTATGGIMNLPLGMSVTDNARAELIKKNITFASSANVWVVNEKMLLS